DGERCGNIDEAIAASKGNSGGRNDEEGWRKVEISKPKNELLNLLYASFLHPKIKNQ
ncbi:unnamed protein product, partial [Dovyalis caffra]